MNKFKTLEEWAGARQLQLVLVFTDIVSSTAIGQKLGDGIWIQRLAEHFQCGRNLASKYDCFVVKVIGDAFFIAFRNSSDAVNFAVEFSQDTGVDFIGIRVGIHSGQVSIFDNDIYGLNVNKTARIQSSVEKEGICLGNAVQQDYVKFYGENADLKFSRTPSIIKNFPKTITYSVISRNLLKKYREIRKERDKVLGKVTVPSTNTNQTSQNILGLLPKLSQPIEKTESRIRLLPPPNWQKKN